jgi:NAD(P)-dependent dehydrogenase (short-subunit alcohol dehydrogenase family)
MKNYLVIGGSSGIGEAVVNRLSTAGHAVAATYCSHPKKNATGVSYHHLDVLVKDGALDFIPESLDGFVYCPGSISLRPFTRLSSDDFIRDFDLQVASMSRILQSCIPSLKRSGHGSVVLFSSVAAQTGLAFHAQVSAVKSAVEGITRALAAEFAPVIRFNCVAPSLTDTPLAAQLLNTPEKREANAQRHPLKKVGSADDIASAVCYLLSEESSWMTGQTLRVDGGLSTLR